MDANALLDAAARELYAMGNGELSSAPGECLPFRILVVRGFGHEERGVAELLPDTPDVDVLPYHHADIEPLWGEIDAVLAAARSQGQPFTLVLIDGVLRDDASSLVALEQLLDLAGRVTTPFLVAVDRCEPADRSRFEELRASEAARYVGLVTSSIYLVAGRLSELFRRTGACVRASPALPSLARVPDSSPMPAFALELWNAARASWGELPWVVALCRIIAYLERVHRLLGPETSNPEAALALGAWLGRLEASNDFTSRPVRMRRPLRRSVIEITTAAPGRLDLRLWLHFPPPFRADSRGDFQRTHFIRGCIVRDAAEPAHAGDATERIVERLARIGLGDALTMRALEEALEIRLHEHDMPQNHLGTFTSRRRLGESVVSISARYLWDSYHEGPVDTLDALRGRTVYELDVQLERGRAALARALVERSGAPRAVEGSWVYGHCILAPGPADGCRLSYYTQLPDWAVERPDPALRERFLREWLASAGVATTLAEVEQAAAAAAPRAGVNLRATTDNELRLELAPPISAIELARIAGWTKPFGESRDVHQSSWHIKLVVGEGAHGPITGFPAYGRWCLRAALDRRPTGGPLPGPPGPPGGRHLLGADDLVRELSLGP